MDSDISAFLTRQADALARAVKDLELAREDLQAILDGEEDAVARTRDYVGTARLNTGGTLRHLADVAMYSRRIEDAIRHKERT